MKDEPFTLHLSLGLSLWWGKEELTHMTLSSVTLGRLPFFLTCKLEIKKMLRIM